MAELERHPEPQRLIEERRQKLQSIRDNGNNFPHSFTRTHTAAQLQSIYADNDKETLAQRAIQVSVSGRIMAKRGPFLVLQNDTTPIQLYADKEAQKAIKGLWDIGDIVGASGTLQRSGKGDLYVTMEHYVMLTKCLHPLPEKYAGLTDTEIRYRQRYVDLIINKDSREVFRTRSKIIQFMREYLNQRDYMEVETPMLQTLAGGAIARPFQTHHHALNLPMYLRIAPELYLKRLVVGGFERVYELNRSFRNEGLSTRHNPEFTMLEFYQAYSSYEALMDITEHLLQELCQFIHGHTTINYLDQALNFGSSFKRLTVGEAIICHHADISIAQLQDIDAMRTVLTEKKIPWQPNWGWGKLQIELFEKTIEAQLQQPTFITQYPIEVSPLARCNEDNPEFTDRFELFIAGREIANGFSELNDSADQAQRFRQQVAEKEAGDDEAMCFDYDYIRALEYGLPPTAGEGIGIDRLVMLLTNCQSIRDVLLFPSMKPESQ